MTTPAVPSRMASEFDLQTALLHAAPLPAGLKEIGWSHVTSAVEGAERDPDGMLAPLRLAADARILVLHEPADVGVARSLGAGLSPAEAIADWTRGARWLQSVIRHKRGQVLTLFANEVAAAPAKVLDHLGRQNDAQPLALGAPPAPDATLRLIARQALQGRTEALELAEELSASTTRLGQREAADPLADVDEAWRSHVAARKDAARTSTLEGRLADAERLASLALAQISLLDAAPEAGPADGASTEVVRLARLLDQARLNHIRLEDALRRESQGRLRAEETARRHQAELSSTRERLADERRLLAQAAVQREAELGERADTLERLNEERTHREALAARAAEQEAALREREAEVAALYASTSWRLSAPLRWLGRRLSRH